MICRLINDKDCIFDIGSNIGFHSLHLSLQFPNSQIYAFEPIPKTFNYLSKNIDLNVLKNIHAFNFGFSNKSEVLNFYFYPEGSGNASSANLTDGKNVEIVKCKVDTLDNFSKQLQLVPHFIKCDVEGAELFVFEGGVELLRQHKPIVFSEILRKWSAKFNYNPNEIFKLFRSCNYRTFTCTNGKLKEFSSMTDETVENNFFFLHTEKHKEIIEKLSR
jgi:FkbM family methyltransferase